VVWFVCACLVVGCGSDGGGDSGSPKSGSGLERLGLAPADAERYAVEGLATGQVYPPYGVGSAFKALGADDRAELVEELGAWARDYVGSDAFEAAYAEFRESRRPVEVVYEESVDEAVERWVEENKRQMEAVRTQSVPLVPEADRAEMLRQIDEQIETLEKAETQAFQRQSIEMQRQAEKDSYESSMADWTSRYPEDPDALVRERLSTFLATCEDVDFDADLVEEYGRMKFESPAYEQKPAEWKYCFRAGEESVEIARDIAKDWLADLD
jgi:hypothetical protein